MFSIYTCKRRSRQVDVNTSNTSMHMYIVGTILPVLRFLFVILLAFLILTYHTRSPNVSSDEILKHRVLTENPTLINRETYNGTVAYSGRDTEGGPCPKVSFRPMEAARADEAETWQHIDEDKDMLVFSAYYLADKSKVFAVGLKPEREVSVTCQLWWTNAIGLYEIMEVTPATAISLPDGAPRRYVSTVYECPVKNQQMPSYVSIVSNTCDFPRNMLSVDNASPIDTYERKFTVCAGPFSDKDIDAHDVVLWVELHKLLGAAKFFLYITSESASVRKVLDYYRARGIVQKVQWPLLMVTGNERDGMVETKNVGTVSALTECVLRNKRYSEFVAVIDINQHILTRDATVNTWTDIISRMKHSVSVYCFGHGYGTLLNKYFNKEKQSSCKKNSRYFVRTRDAIAVYPHKVPDLSAVHVPSRIAILYERYDNVMTPAKRNIDDEVPYKSRYETSLTQNVERVWTELSSGVI